MKKIFFSVILIMIMLIQNYSYAVEQTNNINETNTNSNTKVINQTNLSANIVNENSNEIMENTIEQTKTNKKDNLEIEFNMESPKTIQEGETIYIIELSLGKLSNIENGRVMAFQATIEYDESIIESIAVKGDKNWVLSYSDKNKLLLGDTASAEENSIVGQIEITLKEGLKVGQNTNIKLKEILIIFNEQEVELNKEINFEVIQKQEEPIVKNNIDVIEQDKKIDNTITSKIIPAAGIGKILFFIIVIILIIAIIFKIKSRKIKY